MTFSGFTINDTEGNEHRYGVIRERFRPGVGYPIHYYPDGNIALCDNHPLVTVVHGGPETYGDSQAYYDGPLRALSN